MKKTMNMTSESNQKPQTVEVDPIVIIVGDRVVAPSTEVARKFHKRHDNILQTIRNFKFPSEHPDFGLLNFQETSYADEQGKERPMYNMTRAGFVLLAMGLTGPKALKFKIDYINAFDRMEAERAEHARTLPPPSGDSEETRRALEALSKALDALLTAQDQTSLSKALDALIASQGQIEAVKEVQEKVRYLGNLSRTYLPQISKLPKLTEQVEALTTRTAEISAGQQDQATRFAEVRQTIVESLDRIADAQEDQVTELCRLVQIQDGQSRTINMILGMIPNLRANVPPRPLDISPVVRLIEGLQSGLDSRMREVTLLSTRIKQMEATIDNVAKGIPPRGGISGYLSKNLPREKIGQTMVTTILDNQNSPETFITACMEPGGTAAIQLRFLYRVYAAWTTERYSFPINQRAFKARLNLLAKRQDIYIENLNTVPHLMGMRFKPGVIEPVQ